MVTLLFLVGGNEEHCKNNQLIADSTELEKSPFKEVKLSVEKQENEY